MPGSPPPTPRAGTAGLAWLLVLGALLGCAGARPLAPQAVAGASPGRAPARIELPETVVTAGPREEIALADLTAEQLFDGGTKAFQAGEWKKAALHFDRFVGLHRESEDWASALWNAALAHERLGEWPLALERWERTLARFAALEGQGGKLAGNTPGDQADASFHAALCEHEQGRLEASAARLHALAQRPGLSLARQGEAIAQEAVCRIERAAEIRALAAGGAADEALRAGANGRADGERLLRQAIGLYEKAGVDGEADPALLAQAEFWIGEIYRSYFEELPLDPKAMAEKALTDALESKAQFLLSAQGHYLRAIRKGDGEWATASGFRIGELYESFHVQLTHAPVPPGLDAEQAQVYRQELRKKIRVLLDKAMKVYEQTLATAQRVNAKSAYVDKTAEAVARMKALLLEGTN